MKLHSQPPVFWQIRRNSQDKRARHVFWLALVPVCAVLCLPLYGLVSQGFTAQAQSWPHLLANVLPHYLYETLLFFLGLSLIALPLGTGLAWLLAAYRFPGSKYLTWANYLPLSMPAYITAFIYVDFLSYAGPLQGFLRKLFGWQQPTDYLFPEVRSLYGACLVMSFVLYPYIYAAARHAFQRQHQSQIDVARTLGQGKAAIFFKIILPQARPALIIGLSLVLLEGLNDIGAANFFGLQTLTLAVYSTWLNQGALGAASQLAVILLIGTSLILAIERSARKADMAAQVAIKPRPLDKTTLHGFPALMAFLVASLPPFLGCGLPIMLLLKSSWGHLPELGTENLGVAIFNTVILSAVTALIVMVIGVSLASIMRIEKTKPVRIIARLASFGYAIPGTIIALGLMIALGQIDFVLNQFFTMLAGSKPHLIFSGTIAALILAYVIRFLSLGYGNSEAALQKISLRTDDVAATLGANKFRLLRSIHLPLLRPALTIAAILTFVDCVKELSATLILRPFAFDTLATKTYELASLDKFESASVPALCIVLIGLIPLFILAGRAQD